MLRSGDSLWESILSFHCLRWFQGSNSSHQVEAVSTFPTELPYQLVGFLIFVFLFKIYMSIFYMHWCFACVDYVCHVFACLWGPEVGVRLPGAEVTGGHELLFGYRK